MSKIEDALPITTDGYHLFLNPYVDPDNTPTFPLPINAAGLPPRAIRVMPMDQWATCFIKVGGPDVKATTNSIYVRGIESLVLNTNGCTSMSLFSNDSSEVNIVPIEY